VNASVPPLAARRTPSRFRRIFLYGAARGLVEGLLGLRGLLLASLLGPEGLGAWTLFRIARRYAAFTWLGVGRGLEREVAQAQAAAEGHAPIDDLSARTALGFGLAISFTLAAAALAGSFLTSDRWLTLGMRAFAAAVVAEQLASYAMGYTRSRGNLRRYATLESLEAGLHLVFAVGLALLWGLPGAFAGFVLGSVCSAAAALRRVPLRPALAGERLRRLLRIGLPQALTLFLGVALATADKLVVAALAGTTQLGYYAFAAAIAGLAASFAWVIRTVIFPEVYGRALTAGHVPILRAHLEHTLVPFAWLYPPLLGALALAIGPAVALTLPGYLPAVAAARVFIFTGATMGLVILAALGVVAADRQRVLPAFTALALLANLGLSMLALRLGAGLEGVAAAALVSQGAYAAAVLTVAAREGGAVRPGRTAAGALLPLAWCAAVVFALGRLLPGTDPAPVALAVLLYAFLLLPLVRGMRAQIRLLARGGREAAPEVAPEARLAPEDLAVGSASDAL
jgi:O-antigen/teichoic acid export membrane protein